MNISRNGAVADGGSMNTLFKAGSFFGWLLTGLFIKRTRKPWLPLAIAGALGVASSFWIKCRWTSKEFNLMLQFMIYTDLPVLGSQGVWDNTVPIVIGGITSGSSTACLHVMLLNATEKKGDIFSIRADSAITMKLIFLGGLQIKQ
jgi:hypothetical protein